MLFVSNERIDITVFWFADYESTIGFAKLICLNILFKQIITKNKNFQKMFAEL